MFILPGLQNGREGFCGGTGTRLIPDQQMIQLFLGSVSSDNHAFVNYYVVFKVLNHWRNLPTVAKGHQIRVVSRQ